MRKLYLIAACAVTLAGNVFAGGIVVNNDDWPISDPGFSNGGNSSPSAYAQNVAAFLTGAKSGANIWIDSNNFALTGSSLASALGAYTLTDSGSFSAFTSASLAGYSAIFLSGDALTSSEITALTTFVNNGGGVYIAAGTGWFGGASYEAANFNPFLNTFGLALAPSYNGIVGNIPPTSNSGVLSGVTQLYYNNGNDVSVTGTNPGASVVAFSGSNGLVGVYSGAAAAAAPEPSSMILCGISAVGLGLWRKKNRRS
jgi:hypothetical protein